MGLLQLLKNMLTVPVVRTPRRSRKPQISAAISFSTSRVTMNHSRPVVTSVRGKEVATGAAGAAGMVHATATAPTRMVAEASTEVEVRMEVAARTEATASTAATTSNPHHRRHRRTTTTAAATVAVTETARSLHQQRKHRLNSNSSRR